jgi:hypothetical protein
MAHRRDTEQGEATTPKGNAIVIACKAWRPGGSSWFIHCSRRVAVVA